MELFNSPVFIATLVAILFVALYGVFRPHHDPREPPVVHSGIPVVGHIVGFVRHGSKYFDIVSGRVHRPIFTISMPKSKIYVVTEPELISRLDRHHKTVSFAPIVADFSKAVCGTSQEATDVQNYNILGDHGDGGLYNDISAGMRETLQPGPYLDDMNRIIAQEVCAQLEYIKPQAGQTFCSVKLFAWVAQVATMATTNAVYGPFNPFKKQSIREAFREFEEGMLAMLISPFPQYTAKASIAKREQVAQAFVTYFANADFEQGSALVQTRWKHYKSNKVNVADVARFECGNAIALLVNTIPSVFWMLLMIVSMPGLVTDIRKELDAISNKSSGGKEITIDIGVVKYHCPLLMSTLRESLRYRAMGVITRKVIEDTFVDGYLLKKDAMVQIPISVVHNSDAWGLNAAAFDPRRFMIQEGSIKAPSRKATSEIAYRSFGGGKHLCPGRFFAQNEILAVVSLFVSRYEMKPAGGREWSMPTTFNSNEVGQIATPDQDLDVEIVNRAGFENYTWNVELKPALGENTSSGQE